MTPAISTVICAYTEERWESILSAVASVRRQTTPATETILVVDHNPTLFERARRTLTDVLVLENRLPRGLSGARNTGIEAATGEVVAFLDDDAAAAPDWLERLAQPYADPTVLGVGGAIEPRWVVAKPAWFPEEFNWVIGCTYRGMPTTTAQVRNVIGANMSFRRSLFEEIGGFRSDMGRLGTRPLGCEETEFCIRAMQRHPDGRLIHEPRAKVSHLVTPDRARWSYFRSRCYSEGLSKAQVRRLVGGRDGLASERSYVVRTLPAGGARAMWGAVLHRDPAALARPATILAGLALTTSGYVIGSLRSADQRAPLGLSGQQAVAAP